MRHGLMLFSCLAAVGLAGTAIAAEVSGPIPGKVGVVKPANLFKVVSKAKAIEPDTYDLPDLGTAQDPRLVGARLTVFDTGLAAGSAQFELGAFGWKGLGNPPGSKGYKYKGKDDPSDPNPKGTCKIVLIKDKTIKAACKGPTVTLATPFAGDIHVNLEIPAGLPAIQYCAEFGGTTKKNDTKITKRKDAPPPAGCLP